MTGENAKIINYYHISVFKFLFLQNCQSEFSHLTLNQRFALGRSWSMRRNLGCLKMIIIVTSSDIHNSA